MNCLILFTFLLIFYICLIIYTILGKFILFILSIKPRRILSVPIVTEVVPIWKNQMQKQNTTQSNKKKQLESQKEKKKNKKIKTSYEQCCQMRKIA